MPRRPRRSRLLATAAGWPPGVALTAWRYMWRTTPMHRTEADVSSPEDRPPPIPPNVDPDEIQAPADGAGALFHRNYSARIRETRLSPEELIDRVAASLNEVAPRGFASFEKVRGELGSLRVGDEFVVRMPGPWDGPVRVVDRTRTSFRLATLAGHLEAGQIEFRASHDELLEFEIESWARSGSRLSHLLYDHLRMSKEVQLYMWTSVLERVAELSGGRLTGGVHIRTHRVADPGEGSDQLLRHPRARRALDELHRLTPNFEVDANDRFPADEGWVTDDYCEPLPSEAPGPPVSGGSWAVARDLMSRYEFADPSIVRAVYHPDRPFEERDMLLEIRFHGLRFHVGVRVGGVIDEIRALHGRRVRVWGWSYRTLQGHFEMGQMDYELWKWLDNGEVEFRIHVVSRRARISNHLVRLGFRLFGRREQIRFAHRACERMAQLTAAALTREEEADVPLVADTVTVQPASEVEIEA
jgi:uncharacterized protein (UPF0548 family)